MFGNHRRNSNITVEEVSGPNHQDETSRPIVESRFNSNRSDENTNSNNNRNRFSLLNRSSFFDNNDDPFNDPFFRDPFSMRNSLFESVQRQFNEMESMMNNQDNNMNELPSNTVYYSSSTSSYTGPNGVTHQEHRSFDSSAGTKVHQVRRKIGNRSHDFESITDSNGHERTTSRYNNIQENEVNDFEQEFSSHVSNQPKWLFGSSNTNQNQYKALSSGNEYN
eukprot:TRINITY_DN597_c0_g1_i1.p1 TRINITY_DN597_c0_g1~~TRINITY_DN597_c0_g1_i1.p1  ORF type:complete len:231 (+),score=54.29 TRINITY_DN597_c0_g1_i1:30-695(+)